jgi:hypothetical protein
LLVSLAGVLGLCATTREADPATQEYAVKAALLYNFTMYVNWPESAFADAESPVRVAVMGDDPFGPLLDAAMKDKYVGRHKIVVERLKPEQSSQDCHLLFICRSEESRLEEVLAGVKGKPVLTVSDLSRFTERGGMISLEKPETKIQLGINLERVRQANLSVSARLLNLKSVHIVNDAGPEGGSL